MKPIGDRVLVKMIAPATRTAGGIIIPEVAQEKTQEATVCAIGDGEAVKVTVGARVICEKYAGTTIKIGGEDHVILKADEILAIVSE